MHIKRQLGSFSIGILVGVSLVLIVWGICLLFSLIAYHSRHDNFEETQKICETKALQELSETMTVIETAYSWIYETDNMTIQASVMIDPVSLGIRSNSFVVLPYHAIDPEMYLDDIHASVNEKGGILKTWEIDVYARHYPYQKNEEPTGLEIVFVDSDSDIAIGKLQITSENEWSPNSVTLARSMEKGNPICAFWINDQEWPAFEIHAFAGKILEPSKFVQVPVRRSDGEFYKVYSGTYIHAKTKDQLLPGSSGSPVVIVGPDRLLSLAGMYVVSYDNKEGLAVDIHMISTKVFQKTGINLFE